MSKFKEKIQLQAEMLKANPRRTFSNISLSVAMIGLGLSGYSAYRSADATIQSMLKKGYHRYVGPENKDPMVFFVNCAMNTSCQSVMSQSITKQLNMWEFALLFGGLFGMTLARKNTNLNLEEKLPGFAGFARDTDANMQIYLKAPKKGPDMRRGYLGLTMAGEMMKAPMHLRCSHGAIMGGPGARKSSGYHKQNQLMDAVEKSTSVVIDLKYPDARGGFFDMAQAFHMLGRSIQVFTPFDKTTMRLNLLETVVDIHSALELSAMIIPTKENEGGGAFYRNIERTTLAALLLGIANSENPSIRQVYRKIVEGGAALKSYIQDHPDPVVRETASPMMEIKSDQLNGIVASLLNQLAIFNNADLARATTPFPGQNLDLRDAFRTPTFLYIGIQQAKIVGGPGQTLLQLVKRTIDQAMFDVAMEQNGSLAVHTVFYLDEFPNLGPLPNIGSNFATMRSYNVSYQVTLQNRAQGENIYGPVAFKSFFENNLQFQIIFPAFLKMSDAEMYSKIMGFTSVIEKSKSRSRPSGLFTSGQGSEGESERIVKRELVTPDEMLEWPPYSAIIFPIGVRPIQALMPRLDEAHLIVKDKDGSVRKVMNPLHHYYKELNIGQNPQKFLEEFLGSRSQGNEEPIETVPATDRFKAWAMGIIAYGANVKSYHSKKRCVIMPDNLPVEIYGNPDDIKDFENRKWLNSEGGRIKILPPGADELGYTSLFAALCEMEIMGASRLWVNRYQRQLVGHPGAAPELVRETDPIGFYEEENIVITGEALQEMFQNVPDVIARAQELKLKVTRSGRTYYRLPMRSVKIMAALMGKQTEKVEDVADAPAPKAQAKGNTTEQEAKGSPVKTGLRKAETPAPVQKAKTAAPAKETNAPAPQEQKNKSGTALKSLLGSDARGGRAPLGSNKKPASSEVEVVTARSNQEKAEPSTGTDKNDRTTQGQVDKASEMEALQKTERPRHAKDSEKQQAAPAQETGELILAGDDLSMNEPVLDMDDPIMDLDDPIELEMAGIEDDEFDPYAETEDSTQAPAAKIPEQPAPPQPAAERHNTPRKPQGSDQVSAGESKTRQPAGKEMQPGASREKASSPTDRSREEQKPQRPGGEKRGLGGAQRESPRGLSEKPKGLGKTEEKPKGLRRK